MRFGASSLKRLRTLIELVDKETLDLDEFVELNGLFMEFRDTIGDLRVRCNSREKKLSEVLFLVGELTEHAKTHVFPDSKEYIGDVCRRVRIPVSGFEKSEGIFVASAHAFGERGVDAGVYHWVHPPDWGYEEPDVIAPLDREHLTEMRLSNATLDEFIAGAQEFLSR